MNSISFSSTNLLQNYVAPAVQMPNNNGAQPKVATEPQVATEIVSKEAADATKAMISGFVTPPAKKPYPQLSLQELKADLLAKGKVEGQEKDFKIEQDELESKLLVFENGRPVTIYRYDKNGETKEQFEAVQEFMYPMAGTENGLKEICTTYGADGKFHFRSAKYDKEKSPYKNEVVNNTTTSAEFKEYVTSKGIPVGSDLELIDGNLIVHKYTVFENNKVSQYNFTENTEGKTIHVSKNLFDNKGNVECTIYFNENEIDVTTFEDNVKY